MTSLESIFQGEQHKNRTTVSDQTKIQLGWSLSKASKNRASIRGTFPRLTLSLQPFVWFLGLLQIDVASVYLEICNRNFSVMRTELCHVVFSVGHI